MGAPHCWQFVGWMRGLGGAQLRVGELGQAYWRLKISTVSPSAG